MCHVSNHQMCRVTRRSRGKTPAVSPDLLSLQTPVVSRLILCRCALWAEVLAILSSEADPYCLAVW